MDFALAGPEHEPQLRALLAAQPMEGWVQLAYEREPDFFHGAGVHGDFCQTIVALEHGAVAGLGCRAVREVYVNGSPTPLGYLGGLRAQEWARRRTGLARGYAFLHRLHADGRTGGYLTTIVEGNTTAQRLLTSRRAGLPAYLDLGRFVTQVAPVGRWRLGWRPRNDLQITRAGTGEMAELTAFLNTNGRHRQFFPVVRAEEFTQPLWRGLDPGLLYVARQADGTIAGVVGCWDQNSFKQHRIVDYRGAFRYLRRPASELLRWAGGPPLPAPGTRLHLVNLCLISILNDNAATLAALLDRIHTDGRARGWQFLCIGFHERDPLAGALRPWRTLCYTSRVYWVCWEDGLPAFANLDRNLIPYLETAAL